MGLFRDSDKYGMRPTSKQADNANPGWVPPEKSESAYQLLRWIRAITKELPNLPNGKLKEDLENEINGLLNPIDVKTSVSDKIEILCDHTSELIRLVEQNQQMLKKVPSDDPSVNDNWYGIYRTSRMLCERLTSLLAPQPNGVHVVPGELTNPLEGKSPGKEQL